MPLVVGHTLAVPFVKSYYCGADKYLAQAGVLSEEMVILNCQLCLPPISHWYPQPVD